ncbi:hypothetical protein [Streptomyces sp. SBT349]|uniref:hypothetical protein n=1 Tax=Streptomyces sp. SBT349 TaxID=1580539 RepID=UPI00066B9367|nr:hypothetical protein [Streptomyces sp. SBT349]
MVDPVSLAAISAMLGAVASGMGGEAGKQLYLLIGGLFGRGEDDARRPGPTDDLALRLFESGRRDPVLARRLSEMERLVGRTLGRAPGVRTVPRLPEGNRFFQDRDRPLDRLGREARRAPDGRPRRALLLGEEGIGTTGLVIHFGWQSAERFPDGQLYVDLRGSDADGGLDASLAVRQALRALGLRTEEIPPGLAERAALFREVVDTRRMLIVLDHAHSAAQVRPLLTSAPGVFAIVVSRRRLPGVDAETIEVGPLPDRHALRLLTELAGERRLVDRALVARCGGSALALWTAGLALAAGRRPDERGERGMAGSDSDALSAVLDATYRGLESPAARLYRRMALWPWPAVRPGAAAVVAETGAGEAARLLEGLAEVNLLEHLGDGGYRYRPSVRAHAEREAMTEDGVAGCGRAMQRVIVTHRDFAVAAARTAHPRNWHVSEAFRTVPAGTYAGQAEALAALRDELPTLVAAVLAAAEFGLGETACALCEALWPVQLKDGRHEEVLPALRAAAGAADEQFPGTRLAGRMHTFLALALLECRDFEGAERAAEAALAAEREAGHLRGQATATEVAGLVALAQWEFAQAERHFEDADRILDGIAPGGEGARDLPRARALLLRHRGRARRGLAMRGLARWEEADGLLTRALEFFRGSDPYNTARTLTDRAELYFFAERRAEALPLIDEAVSLLTGEGAQYHLAHLRALRESCVNGPDLTQDGR